MLLQKCDLRSSCETVHEPESKSAKAVKTGTGTGEQDGERRGRTTFSRPARRRVAAATWCSVRRQLGGATGCLSTRALRARGEHGPPRRGVAPITSRMTEHLPELCHCRSKDRVLGSGPMAALRRSPSHAEGGMFMFPPKPDRPDPYGRAPPHAAHGARPNRLDRLRPALPSPPPRRTEQTWSSADRIRNRMPSSAGRCGRRCPDPGPKGEGVKYPVPGTYRVCTIIVGHSVSPTTEVR